MSRATLRAVVPADALAEAPVASYRSVTSCSGDSPSGQSSNGGRRRGERRDGRRLNTFTQALTTANSGLGQFSGGISDVLKSLFSGGGGGGLGGIASGIGSLFGFAEGGLISGLPLVSDGEYIVSAQGTAKHRALLDAINSGKAPTFGSALPSVSSLISNVNAPSIDAHSTNHYTVNNNISTPNADSFRKSQGQIAAEASVHIQRMGLKNG